jgi:cytoskeletal protein CcmA (bactofilin family)
VTAKPKSPPSLISGDLTITGNLQTEGDIQVEGTVEGDIRAHLLTVGEGATIRGEVLADDIVVNGHVVGRIRGIKVRLTASAKVDGDVIHKTIAIESGAQFDGHVSRNEDPLGDGGKPRQITGPNGAKAEKSGS